MNWKRELILFARDTAIAVTIMLILFGILFAYSGVWPPIVVIESSSMQHGDYSQLNVIDTGDIVLVKRTSVEEVVTYVEARFSKREYRCYGDYGDVIIYNTPNGDSIIHRAMLYVQYEDGWKVRGYPFTDNAPLEEEIILADGKIIIRYYRWVSNSTVNDYTRKIQIISNASQPHVINIVFKDKSTTYTLKPRAQMHYLLDVYEARGGEYSIHIGIENVWKTITFRVAESFIEWIKPQQLLLIHDVGYLRKDLLIIFENPLGKGIPKTSGFITMGDYNLATRANYQSIGYVAVDQNSHICPVPVSSSMLLGIAQGELPWFGIIKLFFIGKTRDVPSNSVYFLILSLIVIIGIPLIVENIILPTIKKKNKKDENETAEEITKEGAA